MVGVGLMVGGMTAMNHETLGGMMYAMGLGLTYVGSGVQMVKNTTVHRHLRQAGLLEPGSPTVLTLSPMLVPSPTGGRMPGLILGADF